MRKITRLTFEIKFTIMKDSYYKIFDILYNFILLAIPSIILYVVLEHFFSHLIVSSFNIKFAINDILIQKLFSIKPCRKLRHYFHLPDVECEETCLELISGGRFGNQMINFLRILQLAKLADIKRWISITT